MNIKRLCKRIDVSWLTGSGGLFASVHSEQQGCTWSFWGRGLPDNGETGRREVVDSLENKYTVRKMTRKMSVELNRTWIL